MPRPRKSNRHLPECVYIRSGAYYYVHGNKWKRIGVTLSSALAEYARIVDSPATSMSALLDRVLMDAVERGVAKNTLQQYQGAIAKLKPVLEEFRPEEVRPRDIAQIMDAWRHTPNMANRCLSVLRLAFSTAVRAGICETNPCTSIERHKEAKRDRYITDVEYAAIYAHANPTLRIVMTLAYLTAQRIGDVLSIKEADICEDGVQFTQHKTGKRLCVAWTDALREAVDAARTLRKRDDIYLLPYRKNTPRGYNGVRDLWDRAVESAGVPHATLHDIRAKSLTDARKQGLNATALAGHTTEAQTVRYLRDRGFESVHGPKNVV